MEWLKVKKSSDDESWVSVSDMMAGLMMIFLFISIIYIQNITQYFDNVSDVRTDICNDLSSEFESDIEKWNMDICEDGLLIRFENDSNFEINSSKLSKEFKTILDEFIPRLLSVVWKYEDSVSELRIEGHTDSSVRKIDTKLSGYLFNTKLSQDRSRNVMEYSLNIPSIQSNDEIIQWSLKNMTAHGMSSSKQILENGKESYSKSRRVEFRLRTNAENKLLDLVSEMKINGFN